MQALKEVALRLLNVYVSPYVENLNAEDLSLSVFGGMSAFLAASPKLMNQVVYNSTVYISKRHY
jgi:Na+-transporting NADH:ubiquinone oxidoreductase subunit NqrE